jgi:glycosyltransferase involved in cell wall biosynthesis
MLVTAICPLVGRQDFLPGLITCFLNQTFIDCELLIIEDGGRSVESLIPVHPRIHYVNLMGHRNTGEKRNAANALAHGEIIIHFDSDDWYAPERINDEVGFLISSGKQVVGYHDMLYYREIDGRFFKYRYKPTPAMPWYATGTSMCYWRTWWEKHPFRSIDVGEDSAFSIEASKAGLLASKDCGLMLVARQHAGSTSKVLLGHGDFPEADRAEFPSAFIEELYQ